MQLPKLLDPTNTGAAEAVLRYYNGRVPHHRHGAFTGARFDTWDSLGTRDSDWNRFTVDDVVASAFLAVPTPRVGGSTTHRHTRGSVHRAARRTGAGPRPGRGGRATA